MPQAASELGQLRARHREPHPAPAEIDDQGGVVLHADDPAKAVLIVRDLVMLRERLGRRGRGRRAEGTRGQEAPVAARAGFIKTSMLLMRSPSQRLGNPLPATLVVVCGLDQEGSRRVR